MRMYVNPAVELERQIGVLDREMAEMRRELDFLGGRPAVSAAHASRRAQLAQRIRLNLDWLVQQQAAMVAEWAQLVEAEALAS